MLRWYQGGTRIIIRDEGLGTPARVCRRPSDWTQHWPWVQGPGECRWWQQQPIRMRPIGRNFGTKRWRLRTTSIQSPERLSGSDQTVFEYACCDSSLFVVLINALQLRVLQLYLPCRAMCTTQRWQLFCLYSSSWQYGVVPYPQMAEPCLPLPFTPRDR